MSKVILICGKLCSGKTTLARRIRQEQGGLLLSTDEILTTVFHQDTGERHEAIVRDIKRYLLDKAVEAVGQGVDVLLDWGFWTREERKQTEAFFAQRAGVALYFHDAGGASFRHRASQRTCPRGSGTGLFRR